MLQADVAASVTERLEFATASEEAFYLLTPKMRQNKTLFPDGETLQNCETIAHLGKFAEVYDRYWTKLTSY